MGKIKHIYDSGNEEIYHSANFQSVTNEKGETLGSIVDNIYSKIGGDVGVYGVEMTRGQSDPNFQTWVGDEKYKSYHPVLADFRLAKVKDGKIIGYFDESNILRMMDGTLSNVIIDGVSVQDEGWDVMLVNTRGFYAVLGGSDELTERHLVSYQPFSYKGDVAEYIAPFAMTPDFSVIKDGVQRCIRDNSVSGSHSVGSWGIAAYRENGYPTTSISRYGYEESARKKNTPDHTDKKTNIPYAATFHQDMMVWRTLMFIKFRTKDYHSQNLCGGALSANDGATTEEQWGKKTGVRTRTSSGSAWSYRAPSYSDWQAMNNVRPNLKMLDAQLALSYAKENNIGQGVIFDYDNVQYEYRNIRGHKGIAEGELTGLVTKYLKSADGNTEVCLVQPLVRGSVMFYGNIWRWVSGIELVQDYDKATAKVYVCKNAEDLSTDKDDASKLPSESFDFQKIYNFAGEIPIGSSYSIKDLSGAIFKKVNGGSLHTGECHYNYMANNGSAGHLDRRGVYFGADLYDDRASFGCGDGRYRASDANTHIGGGFRASI